MSEQDTQTKDKNTKTGRTELLVGAGIGAYGIANFLATGFLCPACVVVAPALIGTGIYCYLKSKKDTDDTCQKNQGQR